MTTELIHAIPALPARNAGTGSALRLVRRFRHSARALWQRFCGMGSRPRRRLRLLENLGLGDRRFVAVVEFEQVRFLIGGTPSSIVLLAKLAADSAREDRAAGRQEEKEKEEEEREKQKEGRR